jgi:hypothetical protein
MHRRQFTQWSLGAYGAKILGNGNDFSVHFASGTSRSLCKLVFWIQIELSPVIRFELVELVCCREAEIKLSKRI